MLYMGLSLWAALALGVCALSGAISYVVVYRVMQRSAADSREELSRNVD
jgi:hypothetical protein